MGVPPSSRGIPTKPAVMARQSQRPSSRLRTSSRVMASAPPTVSSSLEVTMSVCGTSCDRPSPEPGDQGLLPSLRLAVAAPVLPLLLPLLLPQFAVIAQFGEGLLVDREAARDRAAAFQLGVELGAQQHSQIGQPHPD